MEQQEEKTQENVQKDKKGFFVSIKNVFRNMYSKLKGVFSSFRKKAPEGSGTSQEQGQPPQGNQGDAQTHGSVSQIEQEKGPSKIRSLITSKRNITIAVVVVVLIVGISLSFYFFRGDGSVTRNIGRDEPNISNILNKGEVVGTFKVGERARFGDLQITLHNIVESSYRTLETDFNGNRITRDYFGAQLEVFNMSHNTNDILFFGMIDDRGNEYERDPEIEFYLDSTKDFGLAREIYPRTIREGHLLFPAVEEGVKKLEVVVFSDVRKERIIFEVER